ncbi:unnamed protein product [Owenia fusiformis]|uniref:Uncharacterized protein n=1 Tax=Owenia fusiformis TaxID=6347 RepID=A0A8S4NHU4_OWEFU|nr:unnamed protein product [Owenia fusiformis]
MKVLLCLAVIVLVVSSIEGLKCYKRLTFYDRRDCECQKDQDRCFYTRETSNEWGCAKASECVDKKTCCRTDNCNNGTWRFKVNLFHWMAENAAGCKTYEDFKNKNCELPYET